MLKIIIIIITEIKIINFICKHTVKLINTTYGGKSSTYLLGNIKIYMTKQDI